MANPSRSSGTTALYMICSLFSVFSSLLPRAFLYAENILGTVHTRQCEAHSLIIPTTCDPQEYYNHVLRQTQSYELTAIDA